MSNRYERPDRTTGTFGRVVAGLTRPGVSV